MFKNINKNNEENDKMNILSIMLRRKNSIYVPMEVKENENVNTREFSTFVANLCSLGFCLDVDSLMTLQYRNTSFYNEILSVIKKMLGVKNYNPMYPNFPKQVMEASDAELFINAIIHYATFGLLRPDYDKLARQPISPEELPSAKILSLCTLDDFREFCKNLVCSKTSLSDDDKNIVRFACSDIAFIEDSSKWNIPNKENKAVFYGERIINKNVSFLELRNAFTLPTDILRLIAALSGLDVSLAEKFKPHSFSRSLRRTLLSLINNIRINNDVRENIDMKREKWKIVAHYLHPYDKGAKSAFFDYVINEGRSHNFIGKFNDLIEEKKYNEAISWLKEHPGEYARRINFLLSLPVNHWHVVNTFRKIADSVSIPELLSIKNFFLNRTSEISDRIFFPKGNVAKTFIVESAKLSQIEPAVSDEIVKICDDAIVKIKNNAEPMGKVFIEDQFKKYVMPLQQRSSSTGYKTLTRGSRYSCSPDAKVIRAFVYWKNINNDDGRVDLDLSCLGLADDFTVCGHISYTNLKDLFCVHSGDITNAPNGACEFIDINLEMCRKAIEKNDNGKKMRYIAFEVLNYTGQNFCDIPEAFVGWMERNSMGQKGDIYDARTVEMKIDLDKKCTITVPMLYDIENNEILWLDLPVGGKFKINNIESNSTTTCSILKNIINKKITSMYDVIKLNVLARGTLVDNPEEADLIFGNNEYTLVSHEYEGTTPDDEPVVVKQKQLKSFDTDFLSSDLL